MNTQIKTILFCILLLACLPSCMVSKCRYSNGWNLGVNLNSIAKQDQKPSAQKQKPLRKNSIESAQSTDSVCDVVSVKLTQKHASVHSNDSLKQALVKNILNPQAIYSPVLKSKKNHGVQKIDKGDFVNHIQRQNKLTNATEIEEDEYESSSYEWLIIFLPLLLGIIFCFIPALAVIGTWIVCIYAAIAYVLIDGSLDLDLSWFTFFVQ